MKQIQKRYYYASLISSILFILCYGLLDFNFFITLALTLIVFGGGVLLFKEKDIRSYDPNIIMNYYFMTSKINNLKTNIKDEKIIKNIDLIVTNTDQILLSLEQRPKKVEQVYDFCDYYLDLVYKLLYQYKSLQNKELSKEEKTYVLQCNSYLEKIVTLFKSQLKNMHEAKMIDINTQIAIFEKNSGIDFNNLEVGDKDGK